MRLNGSQYGHEVSKHASVLIPKVRILRLQVTKLRLQHPYVMSNINMLMIVSLLILIGVSGGLK
jgi:hypothetical protein